MTNYRSIDWIKEKLELLRNNPEGDQELKTTLRVHSLVTQRYLDIAIAKVKRADYAKINFINDDNKIFNNRVKDILSGNTKGHTKAQREISRKRQMVRKPIGTVVTNNREHFCIDLLSKLTEVPLTTLLESRKFDFCLESDEELVSYGQISILNFKQESGSCTVPKSINTIKSYLSLGGCVVFLVMVLDEIYGMYYLVPEDLEKLKQNTKFIKETTIFGPSPFKTTRSHNNSLAFVMNNYFVKKEEIRFKFRDYMLNTCNIKSKNFLNKDESMMSATYFIEQQGYNKLEQCGIEYSRVEFYKGDIFINNTLIEFKTVSKNRDGLKCDIRRYGTNVMDYDTVHSFCTVIREEFNFRYFVFFATRSKTGEIVLNPTRPCANSFNFFYKENEIKNCEIIMDKCNYYIFDSDNPNTNELYDSLEQFKNRPLLTLEARKSITFTPEQIVNEQILKQKRNKQIKNARKKH